MKILILADTLDVGGAETHIYELLRSLFSMGHEVFVYSGGGLTAKRIEKLGIKVYKTDAITRLPYSTARALLELSVLIKKLKPDIIHAHTRRTLFLSRIVCGVLGFPLTFTAHANFKLGIKRLLTLPPKRILAVSEDIGARFKSLGCEEAVIVNNGVNTEEFTRKHPRESALRESDLKIVNASRLDKDTSLPAELLCELAPRLKNLGIKEITVIGGGNDFLRIRKKASDVNGLLGTEFIKMTSTVTSTAPYLAHAPLFVGVSRAALEAGASASPVILCGNEGHFGVLTRDNFKEASLENFCGRGKEKPTGERLFLDIKKALDTDPSILYLRDLIEKDYSSTSMTRTVLSEYERILHKKSGSVLLFGYYGFGNLGDELLKKTIIAKIGKKNVVNFVPFGAKDGIWRLNFPKIMKEIRNAELVIFGGGSLLQNTTSRRSLEYYLTVLRLSKLFGKRVMLYANGIGPLLGGNSKKACRKALSSVDVISARDEKSLKLFKLLAPSSAVCYLSADPVLMEERHARHGNKIAFFIRSDDLKRVKADDFLNALKSFYASLEGREKIYFVSINPKDKYCASFLSRHADFPSLSLHLTSGEELIDFILDCELVVSSRLHPLIISASAYIPFIALCHDPKLSAFTSECRMPRELSVELSRDGFIDDLILALQFAKKNLVEISNHLKSRVGDLRKRGSRDEETLKALLKKPN